MDTLSQNLITSVGLISSVGATYMITFAAQPLEYGFVGLGNSGQPNHLAVYFDGNLLGGIDVPAATTIKHTATPARRLPTARPWNSM